MPLIGCSGGGLDIASWGLPRASIRSSIVVPAVDFVKFSAANLLCRARELDFFYFTQREAAEEPAKMETEEPVVSNGCAIKVDVLQSRKCSQGSSLCKYTHSLVGLLFN